MEKIKPALTKENIQARIASDEKGSLVRMEIAKRAFLWFSLLYFWLSLTIVGGVGAENQQIFQILGALQFVSYPLFVISICALLYSFMAHRAFVRSGKKISTLGLLLVLILFFLAIAPHIGVTANTLHTLIGTSISQ